MYICKECNSIFNIPQKYSEDKTPGGVNEGGMFIDYYFGCPYCGGNYDDVEECYVCNKTILKKDGLYIEDIFLCEECFSLCEDCASFFGKISNYAKEKL